VDYLTRERKATSKERLPKTFVLGLDGLIWTLPTTDIAQASYNPQIAFFEHLQ
jgi:hypothetical protein